MDLDPAETIPFVAIDGLLVALLIGFRVAKDHWPAQRPERGSYQSAKVGVES